MTETSSSQPYKLFRPAEKMTSRFGRGFFRVFGRPIDQALGLHRLNREYDHYRRHPEEVGESFFADALRVLRIRYRVNEEELARVPTEGPVFVVANHPFGGVDGLILCELLTKIRPDFKLLANYILDEIEEFRPFLISVDPFAGKDAARRNVNPLRESLSWLKDGHCLTTFPSGEVSHYTLRSRKIEDPVWSDIPARIIRKTGATAVPIHFSGGNSHLFNLAGIIHPRLRTLLLVRELRKKEKSEITIRIGRAIPARRCAEFESETELTRFLRLRTYLLARAEEEPPREKRIRWFPVPRRIRNKPAGIPPENLEPIAPATPKEEILAAICALPDSSLVYEKNEFQIFHAIGREIPVLMREIARLREITFRDVHEGTGKPLDTDEFDESYIQLFMWNREDEEIVGAYRMGQTDMILPRRRRHGFYTNTLFKYRSAFLEDLDPALEMGRSFIRPEYQRKGATLALLWMGIGGFLARNPRYRLLFGPVSINCDYTAISRDLIIRFLSDPAYTSEHASRVKPKTPPGKRLGLNAIERSTFDAAAHDANDISAMISMIERDGKGMPTLLRHYLKLNARFICFNIDPDFGDVLDGLILVDMIKGDPKVMQKYFGREAIQNLYEYHGADTSVL